MTDVDGCCNYEKRPCSRTQLVRDDGSRMGYCFAHMPDHLIPEAESITGKKRCTRIKLGKNDDGTPAADYGERCHGTALPLPEGTEIAERVCRMHASADAMYRSQLHSVDRAARDTVVRYLPGVLDSVDAVDVELIENPFEELLALASEMKAFKDRIGKRVAEMRVDEFRYSGERIGEQLRAEVAVYVTMMEKLGTLLVRITRLNIDARLMRITERQAAIVEDAVGKTLGDERIALPASKQDLARDIVTELMARAVEAVA